MPPPVPSIAAEICSAVRVPAPLVSSAATMVAVPVFPLESYASPAGKASR